MEKPKHSILLSPEAVLALRRIIHGEAEDHGPSARAVAYAIDGSGCDIESRNAVLLVLGLADEAYCTPKRHITLPPP